MSYMNKENRIPGLILEGGAMRGMYTAGVLDTFMEMGIEIEKIVGVSAGALFGVNYLSKQKGRVIRYCKRFNKDKNYLGIIPLIKEGNIISTEYAYDRVPRILDPFDDVTYKEADTKFYAVVTNLETGEPEYIQIKSVLEQMDTLRASGSMPLVSKPVSIDGKLYLDGAIKDSIPYEWMLNQGSEKGVVILTRDASYRKKPMAPIFSAVYKKKYPKFAQAVAMRHELYNRQTERLKELEDAGKLFVIRPTEPIDISRTEKNPDKLQAVYDLGVKDAKACEKQLVEFLNNMRMKTK